MSRISPPTDPATRPTPPGAKRYRYIKTGGNHFSLAFTYAWMAVSNYRMFRPIVASP